MTSPTKNSNPKLPNFLVETRRLSESFEGLNNSLVQWSLNFFARPITQQLADELLRNSWRTEHLTEWYCFGICCILVNQ